jgi:hypothetical protein
MTQGWCSHGVGEYVHENLLQCLIHGKTLTERRGESKRERIGLRALKNLDGYARILTSSEPKILETSLPHPET